MVVGARKKDWQWTRGPFIHQPSLHAQTVSRHRSMDEQDRQDPSPRELTAAVRQVNTTTQNVRRQ